MSSETSSASLDDRVSFSVFDLTQQCISLLEGCAASNQSGRDSVVETRLADLRLWADGIGAISEGIGSLDCRLHGKPDDLLLVKTILIMLADFVADYATLFAEHQPIYDAVQRIDTTIENLAIISTSIRHVGKALRPQTVAPVIASHDDEELRRHLECIILIQTSKSGLQTELNPSTLSTVQKRLIEANLQRRHRFVIAQEGFNKLQQGQSREKKQESVLQEEKSSTTEGKRLAPRSRSLSVGRSKRALETTTVIQDRELAPATESFVLEQDASEEDKEEMAARNYASPKSKGKDVEYESTKVHGSGLEHGYLHRAKYLRESSTVEGTLSKKEKGLNVPGNPEAQFIPLAAAAEFPRPPPNPKGRRFGKCPCCCQSIPIEEMNDPGKWRQHIEDDLLPYTCIIEDCPSPKTALFRTKKEWNAHVQAEHGSRWHCPLCDKVAIIVESEDAMVDHLKTKHQDGVEKLTLGTLLSLSEKKVTGIASCPLCHSYGRDDSPELIDHILRHVYDFSLRALPWTKPIAHNLSRPIGTFTLPQDEWRAEALVYWLKKAEAGTATKLQLSTQESGHHRADVPEPISGTGYVPDDEYFDIESSGRSSRPQLRHSMPSAGSDDTCSIGGLSHPGLTSSVLPEGLVAMQPPSTHEDATSGCSRPLGNRSAFTHTPKTAAAPQTSGMLEYFLYCVIGVSDFCVCLQSCEPGWHVMDITSRLVEFGNKFTGCQSEPTRMLKSTSWPKERSLL